ncbi:hypothetical protein JKP88DRAFT_348335 [Tribonema minus]|uniref:Uncharacterized protein n=1 Tax=Tribonema minus TaxID=303371 RepID=A0A835Z376_9STRA|nr:hypothetical protein JKP88DRAFT_348335 [Tribonema minus]
MTGTSTSKPAQPLRKRSTKSPIPGDAHPLDAPHPPPNPPRPQQQQQQQQRPQQPLPSSLQEFATKTWQRSGGGGGGGGDSLPGHAAAPAQRPPSGLPLQQPAPAPQQQQQQQRSPMGLVAAMIGGPPPAGMQPWRGSGPPPMSTPVGGMALGSPPGPHAGLLPPSVQRMVPLLPPPPQPRAFPPGGGISSGGVAIAPAPSVAAAAQQQAEAAAAARRREEKAAVAARMGRPRPASALVPIAMAPAEKASAAALGAPAAGNASGSGDNGSSGAISSVGGSNSMSTSTMASGSGMPSGMAASGGASGAPSGGGGNVGGSSGGGGGSIGSGAMSACAATCIWRNCDSAAGDASAAASDGGRRAAPGRYADGMSSIDIHEKQCKELYIAQQEKLPPDQRKPLPAKPAILGAAKAAAGEDAEALLQLQNEAAAATFNDAVMEACEHCGRTFIADRLKTSGGVVAGHYGGAAARHRRMIAAGEGETAAK